MCITESFATPDDALAELRTFDERGYAVIPELLDCERLAETSRSLAAIDAVNAGDRRTLERPWCRSLACWLQQRLQRLGYLPSDACAVQCTLFNKSVDNNWLVALHQDLSIPVARRIDVPGFSGWSDKDGETFVQAPVEILERVLAVRIHLDDCDATNGALRVIPGSHRLGRLNAESVQETRRLRSEAAVQVPCGGGMLMRPLLLHASSKSTAVGNRRVLHFVFGPRQLPGRLRWRQAVTQDDNEPLDSRA